MASERVTVTLPTEIVQEIGRFEPNRSRFIAQAVERELKRRRRQELHRSLKTPHPEGALVAEAGFADWAARLPPEEEPLVDMEAATNVRWVEGRGWVEDPE